MIYLFLGNFLFSGQGYFVSVLFPKESVAMVMSILIILIWILTNCVMANSKTANIVIKYMMKINPMNFVTEGIFRRMILSVPSHNYIISQNPLIVFPINQQILLDGLDFNVGDHNC